MPVSRPTSTPLPLLPEGNLLPPLQLNTEKWLQEAECGKRVRARDPDGNTDKQWAGPHSKSKSSSSRQSAKRPERQSARFPSSQQQHFPRRVPVAPGDGKLTSATAAPPSLQRVLTKLMASNSEERESMASQACCNLSAEMLNAAGSCLSSGAACVAATGACDQLLPGPSPVQPSLQGAWVCACDFAELGSPPPKGVALGMLAHRKTAQFLQRRRYEGSKALAPRKRQDQAIRTMSAPFLLLSSGGICGTCERTASGTNSESPRLICNHPSRDTDTLRRDDNWQRYRPLRSTAFEHSNRGMQPPALLSLQDANISARLLRSRGLVNASRLVHSLSEVEN